MTAWVCVSLRQMRVVDNRFVASLNIWPPCGTVWMTSFKRFLHYWRFFERNLPVTIDSPVTVPVKRWLDVFHLLLAIKNSRNLGDLGRNVTLVPSMWRSCGGSIGLYFLGKLFWYIQLVSIDYINVDNGSVWYMLHIDISNYANQSRPDDCDQICVNGSTI